MSDPLDVIVIGAGFTGLAAAQELRRRGLSFLVLEARDRVGGRVESALNALGERIDAGGQFFCEDMPKVMALARRHRLTFVETPVEGSFIAQPPGPPGDAERIYRGTAALRARMNAIAPDDPAIAGLTVAAWLDRQDDPPDIKAAFHSMIEGLWCQPMDAVPLWYLVDNDRRITNSVYELQYSPKETLHELAVRMAAGLGGRLRLSASALQIAHDGREARVATAAGDFAARHVIVAVPPATAARMGFAPALPAGLRHALAAWRSGSVIKMTLRYPRAFWHDGGLSGMVLWRDIHGMFCCEVSRDAEHAALVAWIAGPLAAEWGGRGEKPLLAEVTRRLAAALGPEAAAPLDILARDWTGDRWSGGGYSDIIMEVGAPRDTEEVLRRGVGPLRFASSELSPSFPGYVEGALVIGRIAAEEAAERLGR